MALCRPSRGRRAAANVEDMPQMERATTSPKAGRRSASEAAASCQPELRLSLVAGHKTHTTNTHTNIENLHVLLGWPRPLLLGLESQFRPHLVGLLRTLAPRYNTKGHKSAELQIVASLGSIFNLPMRENDFLWTLLLQYKLQEEPEPCQTQP